MSIIVSTHYHVSGVKNDNDVRKALQALYDIFASSVPAMNEALAKAGNYEIVQ